MAAGDVARLVGQHADHLQRILGHLQHAREHEDALPGGDERIDRVVVYQMDPDIVRVQPRRAPDRRGVYLDVTLDLRVADDRYLLGMAGPDGRDKNQQGAKSRV
jgi:hypothetical protein